MKSKCSVLEALDKVNKEYSEMTDEEYMNHFFGIEEKDDDISIFLEETGAIDLLVPKEANNGSK